MTKIIKTKAPAFTSATYSDLGFRAAKNDVAAILAVKALAKKNVEAAKAAAIAGYIAGRQNLGADTLTTDMLTKATALIKATGEKSTGKVKPGSFRRSAEQEKLYGAARVWWHRLAKDAGIARADKRGGARNVKTEKHTAGAEKAPATTLKIGKVATPKDLVTSVHAVKGAWAALMVASKPLTLPASCSDKAIKITTLLNELEAELAAVK
jgi:hypothetical protein